jgi:hypothetical protein
MLLLQKNTCRSTLTFICNGVRTTTLNINTFALLGNAILVTIMNRPLPHKELQNDLHLRDR